MRLLLFALAAVPALAAPVTFNREIAPIVFKHCASCHRPGEGAPFSLLTYADVQKRAAQIVSVTQSRFMPPWPPEPGRGDFAGGGRLTQQELDRFAEWVRAGAPEGNAADLPAPPKFTAGWQLGPPDLVVEVPESYTLPAGGTDIFRNFVMPVSVTGTRYVRAVELRPGNKKVVHHANVIVDRTQSLRRRDGEDGQPGFPGMDVATESGAVFDPDSHFLFWKPGSAPELEPPDMAWRLDPGTDLIVNLHLQPSGKAEVLHPSLGLYFSSQPPTRFPMLLQLEHDAALDIPPGSRDFAVTDHLQLPIDVDVLRIYPHAHYLGKHMEAWATLPDGTRRWLIEIKDWDINWQAVYTYREPVRLPRGSLLEMRITYDNSGQNPRNPNRPPVRVRAGNRSRDEMGHIWLQVLPAAISGSDPRQPLQEAVMQRRLEKDPQDLAAHYNLGALFQTEGRTKEAIESYRAALRADASNVTAHNALAAAYLTDDRVEDAIGELRETLRLDPRYPDAHFNLGKALALRGDAGGAESEYGSYLRDRPLDAEAQLSLSAVYISERKYDEALPHLREAARLKPEDADVQTNLGTLLARRGDLAGAVTAFSTALRIQPDHAVARANLARVQQRLAGSPR